jgi:hypothetical protein
VELARQTQTKECSFRYLIFFVSRKVWCFKNVVTNTKSTSIASSVVEPPQFRYIRSRKNRIGVPRFIALLLCAFRCHGSASYIFKCGYIMYLVLAFAIPEVVILMIPDGSRSFLPLVCLAIAIQPCVCLLLFL